MFNNETLSNSAAIVTNIRQRYNMGSGWRMDIPPASRFFCEEITAKTQNTERRSLQ